MDFPHLILARVYEYIQPIDRGERYEDPGESSYRDFWQGPEETGVFYFGPDAEAMFRNVEPVLRRLPIGQNARVVIRAGKASLNPREVRMPRH